jgi:thioredoxin reductase
MHTRTRTSKHDYLIIGAGPAGLQLGYYLQKANRDYLILEAGDSPGSFFKKFPRHRRLISINKVNTGVEESETNLRWDWNSLLSDDRNMLFTSYSGRYFPPADDLIRYLKDFADGFGLSVIYNSRISKVSKADGGFEVEDSRGRRYECGRLIVATGMMKPYIPAIPGVEMCERYTDMSLDVDGCRNKRVLIIGKGNSAFETADHLMESAAVIHLVSPNPIRMAWQSHFVGHLRAVNNNLLDNYQLKVQNAVLDAEVAGIRRVNDRFAVSVNYTHAAGDREDRFYDHVILCTGFRFDDSIFDETCKPELTEDRKLPKQTSEWESVNIKDLYFAGTLMQMRDYKKTMSGFIHGFRYNIQALNRIFDRKYHGMEWPGEEIPCAAGDIAKTILARVNADSAMFLQPGYICDLLALSGSRKTARYYKTLPLDYVRDFMLPGQDRHYTISVEYGHFDGDPFNAGRDPSPDKAHLAPYLHPIIRRFDGDFQVREHHIQDDLENEWVASEYADPLLEFFTNELADRRNLKL